MSPRVTLCGKANPEGEPQRKRVRNGRAVAGGGPEARVSYPWPGRSRCNRRWRAERVTVEKVFDELRIGAKDLSNRVIAGSPRNAFRGSLL
jgi:hypothetical protein